MKNRLAAMLFTVAFLSGAFAYAQRQEVRYYDVSEAPVKESQAYYRAVVETYSDQAPAGTITLYTLDGVKVSSRAYSDVHAVKGRRALHGVSTSWYPNGQLHTQVMFVNGRRQGVAQEWYASGKLKYSMQYEQNQLQDTLYGYYESGKLRRVDVFSNGKLVEGKVVSEEGEPLPYVQRLEQPQYLGGDDGMLRYLGTTIKYPAESQRQGRSGLVVIRLTVDADGTLKDFTVYERAAPALDREALRAVKAMPKWVPGRIEGKREAMTAYVPVRFSIR